jgi:hypothetical protein
MTSGCQSHPIIETLKNKPVVHPIMGTSQNVLLKSLPSFWNGFISCLLEAGNSPRRTLVLPNGKNFARNVAEHFARCQYLHGSHRTTALPSLEVRMETVADGWHLPPLLI